MPTTAHIVPALVAALALLLGAAAASAATDDPGRRSASRSFDPRIGSTGSAFLLGMLEAQGLDDRLAISSRELGAGLGWCAGILTAGIAALAVRDAAFGWPALDRHNALGELYSRFRLSPALFTTPDGHTGVGATLTVLF
jgi:hypothetical protein